MVITFSTRELRKVNAKTIVKEIISEAISQTSMDMNPDIPKLLTIPFTKEIVTKTKIDIRREINKIYLNSFLFLDIIYTDNFSHRLQPHLPVGRQVLTEIVLWTKFIQIIDY